MEEAQLTWHQLKLPCICMVATCGGRISPPSPHYIHQHMRQQSSSARLPRDENFFTETFKVSVCFWADLKQNTKCPWCLHTQRMVIFWWKTGTLLFLREYVCVRWRIGVRELCVMYKIQFDSSDQPGSEQHVPSPIALYQRRNRSSLWKFFGLAEN